MLTDDQIAAAKRGDYSHPGDVLHEHNDCIRMAYEWLGAQNARATLSGKYPDFSLSVQLALPSNKRLEDIGEALMQDCWDRLDPKTYALREDGQ